VTPLSNLKGVLKLNNFYHGQAKQYQSKVTQQNFFNQYFFGNLSDIMTHQNFFLLISAIIEACPFILLLECLKKVVLLQDWQKFSLHIY